MSMDAIGVVVALARGALVLCQKMKDYNESAVRIGQRLMVLIAASKDWTSMKATADSARSFDALKQALTNVNLALEASTLRRTSWTAKVTKFMQGSSLLVALEKAENNLDSALQDFQIQQNNDLIQRASQLAEHNTEFRATLSRVEIMLALLARQNDPNHPEKTLEQAMNEALDTCNTTVSVHTTTSTLDLESTAILPSELRIDVSALECTYSHSDWLGEGGFSEVYQGTYKGNTVAIKRIKISQTDLAQATLAELTQDAQRIASEATVASQCGVHANIMEIYGCNPVISAVDRPILVMECMHTTLFHALRLNLPATFAERLELMKGIASAIEFLHLQGIVHHDVKTLNVLLDATMTIAKLSDFGEAKAKGLATTRLRHTAIMTAISSSSSGSRGGPKSGTMAYLAPEVLTEEVLESSRAADMYAFGVTLWECLTGDIPHSGKSSYGLVNLALKRDRTHMLDLPDTPSHLDDEEEKAWNHLHGIASSCLVRDSRQRPTASNVVCLWSAQVDMVKLPAPPLLQTNVSTAESLFDTPPGKPVVLSVANENATPPQAVQGRTRFRRQLCIGAFVLLVAVAVTTAVIAATRPTNNSVVPENVAPSSSPERRQEPSLGPLPPFHAPGAQENITPSLSPTPRLEPTRVFVALQDGDVLRTAVSAYLSDDSIQVAQVKSQYGDPIGVWNVSLVRDFSNLFDAYRVASEFNSDISSWNVSSATTMEAMFFHTAAFNQDLSSWDVSNVNNFDSMFGFASSFNQDISSWDVSSATTMFSMFFKATSFNQDISSWDVSKVTGFQGMWFAAESFNQDISWWDVSSATSMNKMFAHAAAFNQDLSRWNVSKVADFSKMFYGATAFDRNLCNWASTMKDTANTSYPNIEGMFNNTGCPNQNDPFYDAAAAFKWSPLCFSCV